MLGLSSAWQPKGAQAPVMGAFVPRGPVLGWAAVGSRCGTEHAAAGRRVRPASPQRPPGHWLRAQLSLQLETGRSVTGCWTTARPSKASPCPRTCQTPAHTALTQVSGPPRRGGTSASSPAL